MLKNIILTITVLIAFLSVNTSSADDYYTYAILDKNNKEHTLLQIAKSSVSKYPGWKYQRHDPDSINLWYPSMQDRASFNAWTSTPEEIAAAKVKPNEDDEKLTITLGNRIVSPALTLSPSKLPSYCDVSSTLHKYQEDGVKGIYRRYIEAPLGSARLNIMYIPLKPIKGIYCMTCVEKANCRLYGVANSGIRYEVFYKEKKMPDESLALHKAIEKYLESKKINKN